MNSTNQVSKTVFPNNLTTNNNLSQKKQVCKFCGKSFKSVMIHMRKVHYNTNGQIVSNSFSQSQTDEKETFQENCDSDSSLHSSGSISKNTFHNNTSTAVNLSLHEVDSSLNRDPTTDVFSNAFCSEDNCDSENIHDSNMEHSNLPVDLQSDNKYPCLYCGKFFKSVSIHISKAHPQQYRHTVVKKYASNDNENGHNTNLINMKINKITTPIPENQNKTRKPKEILDFEENFQDANNRNDFDYFESLCSDLTQYLANAISSLPGPKHPAVRYYMARKNKQ